MVGATGYAAKQEASLSIQTATLWHQCRDGTKCFSSQNSPQGYCQCWSQNELSSSSWCWQCPMHCCWWWYQDQKPVTYAQAMMHQTLKHLLLWTHPRHSALLKHVMPFSFSPLALDTQFWWCPIGGSLGYGIVVWMLYVVRVIRE